MAIIVRRGEQITSNVNRTKNECAPKFNRQRMKIIQKQQQQQRDRERERIRPNAYGWNVRWREKDASVRFDRDYKQNAFFWMCII